MHVFPAGAGMAQLLQLPTSANECPATASFQLGQPPSNSIIMTDTGNVQCSTGAIDHGSVHVTYSPTSLRPAIEQALATLPR